MAGRRGCVNSLWSGSDRVRIGERLKATLAGILELDLLRGRHLEMVDAVLDMNGAPAHQGDGLESAAEDCAATSRRQQSLLPANPDLSCLGTTGDGISSRWSTLSWDIPSDLLSSPTPDFPGTTPLDCDSRPSSGFYSVSGSSLSDSCYSVSSEAAPGGSVKVSCRPRSLDHSATHWREAESHSTECPEGTVEKQERRPFSTGMTCDLKISNQKLLEILIHDGRMLQQKCKMSMYPYPSPLHAVALQSPLFTTCQEPSPTRLSPSPESDQPVEPGLEQPPEKGQPPASPSFTQLEQYINRLVHQHHRRVAPETSSRGLQINIAGAGYEGIHPRSASYSSLSGGNATPCRSILGNSARVSLSSIGKRASRNSINLGNLPSVTGEDFNISLHLNLNLNLNPNLNNTLSVDAKNVKEEVSGSCGHLSASIVTPTASPSSSTSTITSTPNWSRRPRISTCPSSVNNRGSLEITGKNFGQMGFSKSLDWSGASREEAEGCPPTKVSDSPPKLNEDSAVVCEISRVSGLPRSVVLSLMEEGVELDAECFRSERERGVGSASPSNVPTQHSSRSSFQHPFGLDQINLTPPSTTWAGAGTGQDYISQQHRLQVSHSDCHSALTSQSGSPHSDNSGHTPTRSSPILPFPHNQSDSASSPGSAHNRVHSPPRLLSNSPFTPAQLSVFRRDSPSQCSLPRFHPCSSPLEGPIRPRGGSLRQNPGAGWRPQDRGWRRRGDGEQLYQGKHASRELIRASTVSSYSGRDYGTGWEDEMSTETSKKGGKFWKGFETRFWGREEEEYERDERPGGFGWRHTSLKETSSSRQDQRGNNSKKKGTSWDSRSSSLRLSRRSLFRSESQGILEPNSQKRESNQWRSSFEISRAGRGSERARNLVRKEEKHHSSTASLFHLSRSQSLEGSSHSLSPLSSPSLSPSPPPSAPLTRSRSFRDLGRKVFGSMRSLSFNKNHKSKKKD
uniref:Si:ch211-168f7.5 n=1 Tax=Cyprinus carpio TaxID=7962 RepID=A0A8C2JFZ1_CYPCA